MIWAQALLKKLFSPVLRNDINALVRSSKFQNELKEAENIPAHKKKSKISNENYRPISILRIFPKSMNNAWRHFLKVSMQLS